MNSFHFITITQFPGKSDMKKLWLCLLLPIAVIVGCATTNVERQVDNNTLVLKSPKLRVNVSPEYVYLGELRYSSTGQTRSGRQTTRREKMYVFVKTDDNLRMERGVTIRISKTSTVWAPDLHAGIKDKKSSGIYELGGKKYQYYTRFGGSGRKFNQFVTDKGYIVPNFLFLKSHGRIVGVKGDTFIEINYFEDATTGTKSKERFQRFNDHCSVAFEVLESL